MHVFAIYLYIQILVALRIATLALFYLTLQCISQVDQNEMKGKLKRQKNGKVNFHFVLCSFYWKYLNSFQENLNVKTDYSWVFFFVFF